MHCFRWLLIRIIFLHAKSQDSSVGTVTGYGLDSQVQFLAGAGDLSSGVKHLRCETYQLPPSRAEAKHDGVIPTLLHDFMAWYLIKQENLTATSTTTTTTTTATSTTTTTAAPAAATAFTTATTYWKQNFLLEFSWPLAITFRLQLPIKVPEFCFKISPVGGRSPGIGPWQSRWGLGWKLGWTTWWSSWCWYHRHIAHNLLFKQTARKQSEKL